MGTLNTYFADFIRAIDLTPEQREDCKNARDKLHEKLSRDERLKELIVKLFIQGSYRRRTIICPDENNNPDVDLVAVTKIDEDDTTPRDALEVFKPFLEEHYDGKFRPQGRSWGITDIIDLDLVITSAPSERLFNII